MASELTANSASSLMGYWLRAHLGIIITLFIVNYSSTDYLSFHGSFDLSFPVKPWWILGNLEGLPGLT